MIKINYIKELILYGRDLKPDIRFYFNKSEYIFIKLYTYGGTIFMTSNKDLIYYEFEYHLKYNKFSRLKNYDQN